MLLPFGDNLDCMAVEKVDDLSPLEWILRNPTKEESANPWQGVRVDRCLPVFEAYAKILHPIWLSDAAGESTGSSRILWSELACRNSLTFHAEKKILNVPLALAHWIPKLI